MAEMSFEEMKVALDQIARFCRLYNDFQHRDFFKALYERIRPVTSAARASEEEVRAEYQNAIAALVHLSDPPSRDAADAIYVQLNEFVAQSSLAGVVFRVDLSMGSDTKDVEPSLLEGDLRANLPPRRQLNDQGRALLKSFRSQLPASDSLYREQDGNDRRGGGR